MELAIRTETKDYAATKNHRAFTLTFEVADIDLELGGETRRVEIERSIYSDGRRGCWSCRTLVVGRYRTGTKLHRERGQVVETSPGSYSFAYGHRFNYRSSNLRPVAWYDAAKHDALLAK